MSGETDKPVSHTLLLPPTTTRDISTFLPLIERLYATTTRLVSTQNTLTSDIEQVLSSALNSESFVEVVCSSVRRQRERYGTGGRTVALWSCLFYNLLRELRELRSCVSVRSVLEIALEYCITRLSDITVNTESVPLFVLCEKLCHGAEHPQLVTEIRLPNSSNSECRLPNSNNSALADTLSQHVTVMFERSSTPSCVLPGYLVNTSGEKMNGSFRTLMVSGDIAPGSGSLGYKGVVKEASVRTAGDIENGVSWDEKLKCFLWKLEVQVVLITGISKVDFINTGIQVVPGISYDVLERISGEVGVDLIPSVQFATPDDIVSLQYQEFSENLTVINSSISHTILLRNPVDSGLVNKYKSYLSRLNGVLTSKTALPGGGVSEEHCAGILSEFTLTETDKTRYDLVSTPDLDTLVNVVFSKLSELFIRVSTLTRRNTEHDVTPRDNTSDYDFSCDLSDLTLEENSETKEECNVDVFDEYGSKVGAWRLALETARVLDSVCLSVKPYSV